MRGDPACLQASYGSPVGAKPKSDFPILLFLLFFKDFMYLFMRDTEREADTQAEGEAGSLQGARWGLDPGTPGSHPEPKADAQPLSHPGVPKDMEI